MFKMIFTALVVFVLGMVLFYFVFTDSYKYSLEAKMKYAMGEYESAQVLAKKAFELDAYNKMAFSILAQSKISVELVDYIKDSDKDLKKIESLSAKQSFTNSDKIKIKFICEVMIARYNKLNPTVMTDKELYAKCINRYKKFKQIHENLFS